jgi:transposase InsO family protein
MNLYFHLLLITLAGFINHHQQFVIEYLQAENKALREQLPSGRIHWTDAQRRTLAEKAKAVGRASLKQLGTVVTPETLLRWYRQLVAAKYDGSKNRKPHASHVKASIKDMIVEMATSNPTWGYTRIRGALYNLGHEVSRNTIKRTLAENGIEPAPERGRKTTWATFLKSHMGAIAGGDFLSVEVLSPFGLIRYFVFFVIDIASRRVHIAGITNQLSEAWMMQIGRNLTECDEGFLRKSRYLILDRDPNYSTRFRKLLRDSGVRPLRLPPRSPNLNAYAERFVRSIKSECLSRVIPLNEKHLRHLVAEYAKHYHLERNHQGLDNKLIRDLPANTNQREGTVRRRVRLGGMLSYYHREAA